MKSSSFHLPVLWRFFFRNPMQTGKQSILPTPPISFLMEGWEKLDHNQLLVFWGTGTTIGCDSCPVPHCGMTITIGCCDCPLFVDCPWDSCCGMTITSCCCPWLLCPSPTCGICTVSWLPVPPVWTWLTKAWVEGWSCWFPGLSGCTLPSWFAVGSCTTTGIVDSLSGSALDLSFFWELFSQHGESDFALFLLPKSACCTLMCSYNPDFLIQMWPHTQQW